jgi:hypothetical protein
MRKLFAMLVGVAALTMGALATAEDKKEDKKTTLEGSLVCTKCELKETKACGHALIVKKEEKKTTYYLVDKGAKEPYHAKVCTSPADAKVTGKVVEKKEGDKKKLTIETPKVEFKE